MAKDWERIYRELGRLIETMPEIDAYRPTDDNFRWLGQAHSLVAEVDGNEAIGFRVVSDQICTSLGSGAPARIKSIVYRCLATAERNAPAGVAGTFIPVGQGFDAYAALAKVLGQAKKDVLIVDPYLDEVVLTDFAAAVPEGVLLRLLADSASMKGTLEPAAKRWIAQHGGKRPLQARAAPAKSLHDRAIFLDGAAAWTVTQSLKDIAKKAHAEIVRADDTAALKIAAYEAIWAAAAPIC